MPYLLLRILPWLVGGASFFAAEWTWRNPQDYPLVLGIALVIYFAASVLIGWKRLELKDLAAKMLLPAIAFVGLALASLMAEQPIERNVLTALFAIIPAYGLELLYLLTHQPSRYPVNGLSRFNLALVPLSAFSFSVGLIGMQIFIHLPKWVILFSFTALYALLAFLTDHPNAERASKMRWTVFGALLGLQIGILSVILPVGLEAIGGIAALAVAWPLRARRYTYEPKPPRSLAVAESIGALVLFFAILLVSRWA